MSDWLTPDTLSEPWFLLLVAFVSFNTVLYVGLSLAKLWPRRRQ
jgi:hypothetical protein